MDDQTAGVIGAIIGIVLIIGLIRGAIKTFQRNWIAALLLLLLLFPIWVAWAFVEIFTNDIVKNKQEAVPPSQNVNVTVVNQADGSTARIVATGGGENPKLSRSLNVDGSAQAMYLPPVAETKACPYCAEDIRLTAVVCRYCNRELT